MRKVVVREDYLMAALDMMWEYEMYLKVGRVSPYENIYPNKPADKVAQIEAITRGINQTSEYL
jgi:hypothetical protein